MLLRLYRVTDKFGTALLKSAAALTDVFVDGLHIAVGGFRGGVVGIVAALWAALRVLLRWTWRALRFGLRMLSLVVGFAGRLAGFGVRSVGGVTKVARGRSSARQRSMARPAATPAQPPGPVVDVKMAEDPLRVQNRALSITVVMLGFLLLGAIVWFTSQPQRTPPGVIAAANPPGGGESISFAPDVETTPTVASIVNTPVPTVTSIPAVLEVRGSMVYTAREFGQTDIWVAEVGSAAPIRLTNSPEDERDPAWSPDGRKLAYASREDGNWEIYVYDMAADQTLRLTYDLAFQANPSWSPDGAFIVYESYQGSNLDLYVVPVDGSELPIRLTDNPAPDFSPDWSPDGRRIAFTSWRDGNQDIYTLSLDDPRDIAAINITNTPTRNEDYPAWSPEGDELIAFSALDEGIEKVFVKRADQPNTTAQVLERGRTPAWSPDGASVVFAVDSINSTHLVASPFTQTGVATEIIPVLRGSSSPDWTSEPLPATLVNSGGVGPAVAGPLFDEQFVEFEADPPYRLDTLVNVEAPNPVMNDRVNDSFNALREHTNDVIGADFLGELEDAFWRIDRPPQPGEERRNWHMTGRAFAINRNLIAGFPPPIEVVREDISVSTYWRVYVRVADDAQNGQLGEPLRRMPWDFASRGQGDVEAYDEGGRLRDEMPEGYYIDLTQLVADFGWERMPAGRDWRANFNSINFWMFRKSGQLSWYEAMREIYTEPQLGGFAPTATPLPAAPATEQAGS